MDPIVDPKVTISVDKTVGLASVSFEDPKTGEVAGLVVGPDELDALNSAFMDALSRVQAGERNIRIDLNEVLGR